MKPLEKRISNEIIESFLKCKYNIPKVAPMKRCFLACAVFLMGILIAGNGFSATYDATGTWTVYITDKWNNCGDPNYDEEVSVVIIQTGDSVTIDYDGYTFTGKVSGAFYNVSGQYPEDWGMTNETSTFTLTSNTSGTGTSNWTWTDGDFSCNGGYNFSLTKSISAPVADFTANPTSGERPLTVNFSDQSTGNITNRSWNFGDGATSTQQDPLHTYSNPGTYTVSLTVTGPGGSDTETKSNYIKVNYYSNFDDVPPGYWAEEFIGKIYKAGITSGCSQNPPMYCPEDPVTRAQMAVFLERGINGSDYSPPGATGVFDDCPVGYWAADWVEQFYADGITSGCSTNPLMYCPDDLVTRAQMAVFLLRSMYGNGYTPPSAAGIFDDVPVTHWAADWIEQLYDEGITGGCSTNPPMYCPDEIVNRAQMAVFIVRAFDL